MTLLLFDVVVVVPLTAAAELLEVAAILVEPVPTTLDAVRFEAATGAAVEAEPEGEETVAPPVEATALAIAALPESVTREEALTPAALVEEDPGMLACPELTEHPLRISPTTTAVCFKKTLGNLDNAETSF